MATASVNISTLLLEAVFVVVDRQTTLSHQFREIRLRLIHLLQPILRNVVQLLFGLVAVRIKELHALLCAEHTTPMPRVFVLRQEEDDTPPLRIKTLLERPLLCEFGVGHQRYIASQEFANIVVAQRIISHFFCVGHYK